jgi:2-(1,2-epoxy-1,2-dihydrophenyl)acetyl-CoA isomerase
VGIRFEVTRGVGRVHIEFQQRRNALRPDDALEIAEGITRIAHNAPVVVVSGTAEAFCAGADLAVVAEMRGPGRKEKLRDVYARYHLMSRALMDFPGIVIAAIDGPAIGLGADLALACTQRYVGTGGWLQQGWRQFGLIPGAGGLWSAVHSGGQAAAWHLLTCDKCDGATLERFGLATAVDGSAESAALETAARLGTQGADWIRAYSSLMAAAGIEPFEVHLARCLQYQLELVDGTMFSSAVERIAHVLDSNDANTISEEDA